MSYSSKKTVGTAVGDPVEATLRLAENHLANLNPRVEHGTNAMDLTVDGYPCHLVVEPDLGPLASNIVYVYWRVGEPRQTPPEELQPGHAACNIACCACTHPLLSGQLVQAVVIAAETPNDRKKLAQGLHVPVLAVICHSPCVCDMEPLE